MAKANIIYKEQAEIYAKYNHPQSEDFLEYISMVVIKDSGKQPITMTLKFVGMHPSFAPMPPEKHTIKAKDTIDLILKLTKWFRKYGYEIKLKILNMSFERDGAYLAAPQFSVMPLLRY